MVTITMKDNFPDVERQLKQLHADVRLPATVRAVNATLNQGKTRMVRAITAAYNVTATVVRDGLRVRGASRKAGQFAIEGYLESPTKRGRSRNLIHFKAKQTAKGVQVQIKRGGPKTVIRGAFIANKDNKFGGVVLIRQGKARLPIVARQTIDTQQMFNARKVNDLVLRFVKDKFPEIFAREAKFYTDRFNARKAA
jgi:hypothetical protein